MPIDFKPYLLQAGFFAVMGVGLNALRALTTQTIHPLVTGEITMHPGLAMAMTQLANLQQDRDLQRLVQDINEILRLDSSQTLSAQWWISRKNADVVKRARKLCQDVKHHESDTLFVEAMTCSEEVVPQLEGHLDNLLHNHLLARSV